MNAQRYIKENESIIKHLNVVERVISDLRPIRNNEEATRAYYDSILTADKKYERYLSDYRDWTSNGKTWNEPIFSSNQKEIDQDIALEVRCELRNVVEHDRSYGYLFYLLGIEYNQTHSGFPYECVYYTELINFSIDFCFDDIKENLVSIHSDREKLALLIDRKKECLQIDFSQCNKAWLDDLNTARDIFVNSCQAEIESITELIKLRLPTDTGKSIPKKVIEMYNLWENAPNKSGFVNIFAGIEMEEYLTMVKKADFSEISQRNHMNRIRDTIYLLSEDSVMGKDWGEKTAKSIGKELTGKATNYIERDYIKNAFAPKS
jgi:hypothetical protein